MPMHDWTRVEPGVYHVLHGAWIYAISDALNNGLLPPAYYAMPEQWVPVLEVDVLALQGATPTRPERRPPFRPGRAGRPGWWSEPPERPGAGSGG